MSQRDDDMVVDFAIAPDKASAYYGGTPDDMLFEADVHTTVTIMDALADDHQVPMRSVPDQLWERVQSEVAQGTDAGVSKLAPEVVEGLVRAHTLASRPGARTTAGLPPGVGAAGALSHHQDERSTTSTHQAEPRVTGVRRGVAVGWVAAGVVAGLVSGMAVGLWGAREVLSPAARAHPPAVGASPAAPMAGEAALRRVAQAPLLNTRGATVGQAEWWESGEYDVVRIAFDAPAERHVQAWLTVPGRPHAPLGMASLSAAWEARLPKGLMVSQANLELRAYPPASDDTNAEIVAKAQLQERP